MHRFFTRTGHVGAPTIHGAIAPFPWAMADGRWHIVAKQQKC